MTEVTKEMIYRELVALEKQVAELAELTAATLEAARATNRDLARGQARIDALKLKHGFTNQ
jgi:hypothetical protein